MDEPSLWETLSEGELHDWKVMRVQTVRRAHIADGRVSNFTVCHAPGWVNIVPLTKNGTVVLVEQFRHGTGKLSLEVPGGIVNADEDFRVAAERECTEETGYASSLSAELLGVIEPNPAFMNNRCSVYVWYDCELRQLQQLDPMEDIRVHEMPVEEFFQKIKSGEINHSLVVSAAALLLLNRKFIDGTTREEVLP